MKKDKNEKESRKKQLIEKMPEHFKVLYERAKKELDIDLWDRLEDQET